MPTGSPVIDASPKENDPPSGADWGAVRAHSGRNRFGEPLLAGRRKAIETIDAYSESPSHPQVLASSHSPLIGLDSGGIMLLITYGRNVCARGRRAGRVIGIVGKGLRDLALGAKRAGGWTTRAPDSLLS
jgi:hypothetical protein